jgi:hypothetical protein
MSFKICVSKKIVQQGTIYPSFFDYAWLMICIHAPGYLHYNFLEAQLLQAGSCTYADAGVVRSNFICYKMTGC